MQRNVVINLGLSCSFCIQTTQADGNEVGAVDASNVSEDLVMFRKLASRKLMNQY
jgi:hypothetical protein